MIGGAGGARAARRAGTGLFAALLLTASRARPAVAQACHNDIPTASAAWNAPLDQRISLHARDVSLREALDRASVTSRVHLSYSSDLLPLDRVECVAADSTPLGDLLVALLHETTLTPVAVATDQVALAPRMAENGPRAPATMASAVGMLDRVVVTGTANGGPERQLTVALDVVDGAQLRDRNVTTVSDALAGFVPGVWTWAQSPASLLASYASIRGASSFGISYPKIYIDGIEVANPLLVSQFNTDAVERIEVIRGPQGSALYGTDAISGVVNIVTRHDGVAADGGAASIRSSAGVAESDYATGGVFTQEHAVSLRSGSSVRSAGLDVSATTMGDFIPNGSSRSLVSSGSTRIVGSRGSIVGTARFFAEDAGAPSSPILTALHLIPPPDSGRAPTAGPPTQAVDEYTLGATGTFAQNERWTHSLVAGIDGYRLWNVATSETPIPTEVDSALRAAQGGADRATVRLSSVAHFGSDAAEGQAGTLTLSAEQSTLREATTSTVNMQFTPGAPPPNGSSPQIVTWQSTTGVTAQGSGSLDNRFFMTGGLRLERNDALSETQYALLPMIGTAYVADDGPWTIKLRAAYGKGIHPAQTSTDAVVRETNEHSPTQATLAQEEQSGVEGGIDLQFHRLLTLQVTGYDQLASGLVQQVGVADSTAHRYEYALENVGAISNRGVEAEASAQLGALSLGTTFSAVDSRITQVAAGYTGDLRVGDRPLGVPAQTAGIRAGVRAGGWATTATATRAFDWINYDRVALVQAYVNTNRSRGDLTPLTGPALRNFWRQYDGGTHLSATATRDLPRGVALEITGANLLNRQRGEPDNVTVVPGVTLMTGLRVKF